MYIHVYVHAGVLNWHVPAQTVVRRNWLILALQKLIVKLAEILQAN